MRNVRAYFLSAFIALFLVGCKTTQTVVVQPNFNEINPTPAKKTDLSESDFQIWSHLDITQDSIAGMSLAKAYQFLEGKKSKEVIVAIADSGVDVKHEDLKDVLWINPSEIDNNNIDDDKNGFEDDVFGWNFLGNKAGDIVTIDQLEITRLVKKGKIKFANVDVATLSEEVKKEYDAYLKLVKEYDATIIEKEAEISKMEDYLITLGLIQQDFTAVKELAKQEDLTLELVNGLKAPNLKTLVKIKNVANILQQGMSEENLHEEHEKVVEYLTEIKKAMKGYDLEMNYRQTLGDDLYDISDKFYGNNNVLGTADAAKHGTHVAGIVAANTTNNIGAVGVANNVKIMTVRIVPDGDEHDKDVALGIKYAVDNGAKIINTSFGKRFSPNKDWVYDAIKYAADNDVLIVNAAGNDGKNIDTRASYPTDSKDMITEFADNVITIGASSLAYDKNLPANFSNYGKINVDVFAPGVDIYSSVPNDKYEALSGTSMAAPSTAGVAALIRGYYPNLSAKEVKEILMNSGVKINFNVIKPGSQSESNPEGELVPFSELSVSGRIINAYNALQLADYISNKK
ncbi:S8 family serine peptidase [Polaribacter sp. MED152]|uniref:S8 family serine peptidase n=1 Tax=Polaribacter sp. MED152 TaxID=313598 RepID=UPI000068C80A|nr:S8 family serine peptidase [Polaribacter sp. MED152]EAQ43126.1 peptidase families S8 and S53 [Polaribacter sp. MED152]